MIPLFWWLLGNAAIATVLAICIAAPASILRRPRLEHGLWLLVLVKFIAPPLIVLPWAAQLWGAFQVGGAEATEAEASTQNQHPVGVISTEAPLPWEQTPLFPAEGLEIFTESGLHSRPQQPSVDWFHGSPQTLAFDGVFQPDDSTISSVKTTGDVDSKESTTATAEDSLAPTPAALRKNLGLPGLASAAAVIWLLGGCVWLAQVYVRSRRFSRGLNELQPAPRRFQSIAVELSDKLGLFTAPTVYLTSASLPPLLWGRGRRAKIVLPRHLLARLDEAQIKALIAHELAHFARNDFWSRGVEIAAVTLHWWNPIAWWAHRRLRAAEEECCDAIVLRTLPDAARSYARALFTTLDFLVERRTAAPLPASTFWASSFLEEEISHDHRT